MSSTTEHKRPFETYETTVIETVDLTPRVKGLRFELNESKSMAFKAGQFVQMHVPLDGEKVKRTSYSIASPPRDGRHFDLCITRVENGVSSNFLHGLKAGDKVTATGPLGRFTLPDPLARDSVFVCTGSGIAPFRSMINDLFDRKSGRNVYLVFGNRHEEDILYRREWEALARSHPNFRANLLLSRPRDGWSGPKGYVQDHIVPFVPDPLAKDFFICGLVKMIDAVQEKLLSLGVPKEQIHFERYD